MRQLFVLISLSVLLAACGGSSKKSSSDKTLDTIHKEGKESLEQVRGTEIEMLSEVVYKNDYETWVNLTVEYEGGYEDYVLILNRDGYMYSEDSIEMHNILQPLLDIDFVIFKGKMNPVPDINSDGQPEYLISAISPIQQGKTTERLIIFYNDNNSWRRFEAENKLVEELKVQINEKIEIDTVTPGQPRVIINGSMIHTTRPGTVYAHYRMPYRWNHETEYLYYIPECEIELPDGRTDLARLYQINPEILSALQEVPEQETEYYYARSLSDWGSVLRMRMQNCLNQPYGKELTELLEMVSGVPVLNPYFNIQRTDLANPDFFEEYSNLNPEFIQWASDNMIPAPDHEELNGFFFKYLYKRLFQYGTRTMAATYLYLNKDDNFEMHLEDYIRAASGEQYHIYGELGGYLERRFEDFSATEYGIEELDHGYGYIKDHMSFWLRRGLDGSHLALWEALSKILKSYDPLWYKQYGKPPVSISIISEEEYYLAKNNMPAPSLKTEHHRLNEVYTMVNAIDVLLDTGGEVSFTQNNSDDERMAKYSVAGYLLPHDMVIIEYHGWENSDYKCVKLSNGYQMVLEDPDFSPGGKYVFQLDSDSERDLISISTFDGKDAVPVWSKSDYWVNTFWASDTELYAVKPLMNGEEFYKLEIFK